MKTVFLILNYKTYNETIQLIDELLSEELNDRLILIVDNGSPNESYKILTNRYIGSEKVEVISTGKNIGYAKGNNYGLRYAKKYNPQYVCIINNDVHFSLALIDKLECVYSSIENVALLSPVQHLLDGKPAVFSNLKKIPSFYQDLKMTLGISSVVKHIYCPDNTYKNLQKVEIVPGAFLFISYPLFENIGFFFEGTFLFCEERFTAKKIRDQGLCSYILLDEYYIHAHSLTINKEKSNRSQLNLLFKGRLLYTKYYRKYSNAKICMLYIAYGLGNVLRFIKRFVR